VAPEPTPTASFLDPSYQSLCRYVYLLSLLGNGSVKRYRGNEHARNNRIIVDCIVFYAVRVISNESRRLISPVLLVFIWTLFQWSDSVSARAYKPTHWAQSMVCGFPTWPLRFDSSSGQVLFVVDKVSLGQVFSKFFFSFFNAYTTNCSIYY
jgi:hypothetical protein